MLVLRGGSKGGQGTAPPVKGLALLCRPLNEFFCECDWASGIKNGDYMLVFMSKTKYLYM